MEKENSPDPLRGSFTGSLKDSDCISNSPNSHVITIVLPNDDCVQADDAEDEDCPSPAVKSEENVQKKKKKKKKKRKPKIPRHLRSAPIKRIEHPSENSVAWSFLLSVVGVMLAILVGLPLMAASGLLYPVALFVRALVASCFRCGKGDHPLAWNAERRALMFAPTDTQWIQCENPCAVVHCLLLLERGLDVARMRELISTRVVNAEDEVGVRLYPRLRQRALPVPSGHLWVEDDNFSIDNHVFSATGSARRRRDLENYVSALLSQPLRDDRSPWEVHVITGYEKSRSVALVVRIHQCVTDGVSLVKLLYHSLADSQVCSHTKPRFGGTTFPLNVFRALITGPMTFCEWLLFERRDCNLFRHNGANRSDTNTVIWSDDINLPQVNRIKQVTRSALNDVILAALTGSLREYFRSKGISNPYDMTINIPVDLRYEPKRGKSWVPMGTSYSVVNLSLPTNTEGVIPQLWEVRSRLDDLKTSADPVIMYGAIHILYALLPACIARRLIGCVVGRASMLFSNMLGPDTTLLLAGYRLKTVVFWMPPRDGVPFSVSAFTYGDALKLGIIANKNILPDPQRIIDGFVEQIDKMSKLLSGRRIPGEHRRRSFILIAREEVLHKPPVEELQQKLHDVQDELHSITQQLDAAALMGGLTGSPEHFDTGPSQLELTARMTELKEQFSDLLAELRRRKSIAEGIPVSLEDDDEDLDGELRRPRKRALSVSSSRKSSISITSTSRPLTTPTTSHHSSLSQHLDCDVTASPSQEQQRFLLDQEQERPTSTRRLSSISWSLDKYW